MSWEAMAGFTRHVVVSNPERRYELSHALPCQSYASRLLRHGGQGNAEMV